MKVVIIGASHSGLSAARTIKQLKPETEITILDQMPTTAWGYVASGVNFGLKKAVSSLEELTTELDFFMENDTQIGRAEVLAIDPQLKEVTYRINDRSKKVTYDQLVLAMGSGIFDEIDLIKDNDNVVAYKNLRQSEHALAVLREAQRVAIVGSGYIALELADTLIQIGKEVHIIDSMSEVLFRYFDRPISQLLIQKMAESGVNYHPSAFDVDFISKKGRVTAVAIEDREIQVDAVVTPLPAAPNTRLLEGVVDLYEDMTVIVNEYLQTSQPDIYAVGDIVPLSFGMEDQHIFMPLVDRAVRMGRTAGMNITGLSTAYAFAQKVTASRVFDTFVGACGLTKEETPFFGIDALEETVKLPVVGSVLADPGPDSVLATIVFDRESQMVLGLQLASQEMLLETLNIASSLIVRGISLEELAVEEFLFMPAYTGRFNLLNQIAYKAVLQLRT